MKREMQLFRSLEGVLDRAIKGVDELREKRNEALEIILKDPPRVIQVTKEVVELRAKALRSKQVREVMARYDVKIGDVALVNVWDERHWGLSNGYPDPGSIYTDPNAMFCGTWNRWDLPGRYIFGSPKDKMKFFFRDSKNNRLYFCGFMVNFPMKHEKSKVA